MRGAALVLLALVLVAGDPRGVVVAQEIVADESPPVPRTPWGDPDLQGLWNYSTNTFLQRHPDFGTESGSLMRKWWRPTSGGRRSRHRSSGAC